MGKKSRDKKLRRMKREQSLSMLRGPRAIERFGFEITDQPLEKNPGFGPQLAPIAERAYHLVYDDPAQAIVTLEKLAADHPQHPEFLNWLSNAYSHAGRESEAVWATRRNYRENPDYLFARLNYAETCLHRGDIEEAGIALRGQTNLKDVFPDRTLFHFTEFVSFNYVVGLHAFKTGNVELAIRCLVDLKAVAPESAAYEQLSMAIFASLYTEIREGREGDSDRQAIRKVISEVLEKSRA